MIRIASRHEGRATQLAESPAVSRTAYSSASARKDSVIQSAPITGPAVIGTVLDALSAPAGAEDIRSHEQRYHDALAEAMRRLVAGGLVPDRAGQPA